MRTHRALATATVLAATLTVSGITATTASATGAGAAAVTCSGWSHSVEDGRTGAVRASAAPAAVHTGPYGACTTVGTISDGVPIQYDCYVVNDYGNTWTWVHGFGWVFDDYLVGNGAYTHC
ncbi:hypothetical protein [Streptomyces griseoruber]|uniref:SH3b domain-containing protein n=1 Tax=Streptomyces griseoruber TaxID=1943 RepID=A0A117RER9_9ACTN|nr:hypothetical protein [Streptomyces griseoruber]KUN86741.1 hypothetical protein AQJ64_05385 [Streptomyces griseoruber]